LRRKLLEEATEVSTAVDGPATMGELADLVEVVYALAGAIGHTPGDLDEERARRARDRGGFRRGVVLTIGPV
jgi:predicted house-cleaning noncanonical NTP pyrophosphatase (MazG superfamily)